MSGSGSNNNENNENNENNDTGEELGLLPFDDGSTGRLIRRQWHDSAWWFSVVDVIAMLG